MISLFVLFVVCQKEQDHMTMTYFGRIGVSLMLRYHKTHQWAKVNEHACYFTQLLGCLPRSVPHPELHHFWEECMFL